MTPEISKSVEISEAAQNSKFADCPLGRAAEWRNFDGGMEKYDAPIQRGDLPFLPKENGRWEGSQGDSKWCPDPGYTPLPKREGYNNPDGMKWDDIFKKYDISGITFSDGEPDFSPVGRGSVEIENFSASRTDNFDKADIALAEHKGCSPAEVAAWRRENGYTWHECRDQRTMIKAPHEVHANIPHSGGIAAAKKGNGELL
ncbi:MAG: HNH endonuclease [Synergistaceae bacterium]|jgi:hypothetical protein|nr:HNH endonuclease [Synergistaceae bacterium]